MKSTIAAFVAAVLFALAAPFLPTETPADPAVLQRPFTPWTGKAFVSFIYVPYAKADTDEARNLSTIQLFEDGKPLGPNHTTWKDIATLGGGRFMFWESPAGWTERIVFSSSDGTDPNTNGRTYRVFDPEARDPYPLSAEAVAQPKPTP